MCAKENISANQFVTASANPSPRDGRLFRTIRRIGRHLKMGIKLSQAYVISMQYKDLKEVKAPPIELDIHELIQPDEDELQTLASFGFYTNIRQDVLQHLAEGQHCYVAKHNGKVISCFWTEEDEFYDSRLNRKIQLAENEVYNLASYTLPEFRGMGILPYLYQETVRGKMASNPDLQEIGFIDVHNTASLHAVSKLGVKKIGRIGYIGIFGIRFQFILGKNVLPNTKHHFIINK